MDQRNNECDEFSLEESLMQRRRIYLRLCKGSFKTLHLTVFIYDWLIYLFSEQPSITLRENTKS
jgi:hypothetical protein